VLCARIYSTGLNLRQRRISGIDSPVPAARRSAVLWQPATTRRS
jgi:hypothetical protein